VLTASDVNTWLVPMAAVKPADTARASTTTVTNDPDMVLALGANSTYAIYGVLFYTGANAAGHLRFTFTVPGGATGAYFNGHVDSTSGVYAVQNANAWTDLITSAESLGTGVLMAATVMGVINLTGSGNLQLQWAQGTSNATATTVKANSFWTAQRIS
jgi:hypothetical protein